MAWKQPGESDLNNRWEEQPYIVAMTASALVGDRERLLEAGMDDYVAKPVMIDKLVEALLRASSIESSSTR